LEIGIYMCVLKVKTQLNPNLNLIYRVINRILIYGVDFIDGP